MAFKIRRGTNAERLTITPAQGELIFTTDTKKLYVGDGSTVGGVAVIEGLASTNYVDTAIDNLINGSIPALDTLKELADALGSDPNFASNLTTALAGKADLTYVQTIDTNKANISSLSTVATSGNYNDLTNKPTIPSVTGLASETYVNNKVADLVNGATSTLDTLKELAEALGNDQNFATTVTNSLANKANTADLADVATSGDYADLINVPFTPNLENVGTNILPSTDVTYDLGSPTNRWRDLYLSNNTLYLGNDAISVDGVYGLALKQPGGGEGYGAGSVAWTDQSTLVFSFVEVAHPLYGYLEKLTKGDKIKELAPGDADFTLTVTGSLQFGPNVGGFVDVTVPVDQPKSQNNVGGNYYVYVVEFIKPVNNFNNLENSPLVENSSGWYDIDPNGNATLGAQYIRGDAEVNIRPSWDRTPTVDFQFKENGNIVLPNTTIIASDADATEIRSTLPFNVETTGTVRIITDTVNNGHQWEFGDNGNLTLPAGGDIVDSTGVSVLGAGANTGNISFDANTIYNNDSGNIYISPDNPGTNNAYIDIPFNGANNALSIVNSGSKGTIVIGAQGGEGGGWEFRPDTSSITFPDSSKQYTAPGDRVMAPLPFGLRFDTANNIIVEYNKTITEIDPATMTSQTLAGNTDDGFLRLGAGGLIPLPFNLTFRGTAYDVVGVGSNSYVTFGGLTSNYNFGDDPTMGGAGFPAIIISEADNSFQRVYTHTTGAAGSRQYTIRYEGTNNTTGTPGNSNIIWQMTFYEATPQFIDLLILSDARGFGGISGMTSGSEWTLYEGGNPRPRVPFNAYLYAGLEFPNSTLNFNGQTRVLEVDIAGGGGSTGNITFNNNTIGSTGNVVDISVSDYAQLNSNASYVWVDSAGAHVEVDGGEGSGRQFDFTADTRSVRPQLKMPQGAKLNFGGDATTLGGPSNDGYTDKIRLWDFEGGNPSGYNYAIGAEGGGIWFSTDVNNGTGGFRFYSQNVEAFKIGDDGVLYVHNTIKPVTNNSVDLGAAGTSFKNVYAAGVTQSHQRGTNCPVNVDTVVYTATDQYQHAIKIFAMVEGNVDGEGSNWHTQACDIIAVRGYNNNTVFVTTYGVTYTSTAAFATFDAQWNATSNRIEITCRPVSTNNSVVVSIHATEITSQD